MDEFKRFVDAVCAIAIEMKMANDLKRAELAVPDGKIIRIPVDAAASAPAESSERSTVIAQLNALGVKFHGKTSTENLQKLLAETQKPKVSPDPFEEPAKPAGDLTEADVRKAMSDALAALYEVQGEDGKAKVLGLLGSVAGAARLSEVPKEKYAALIDAAQKLVKKELGK